MTKEQIQSAVEARMANGNPFTLKELRQLPAFADVKDVSPDRVADALIQRWRKRGWVTFTRVGRDTVWTLTEEYRNQAKA